MAGLQSLEELGSRQDCRDFRNLTAEFCKSLPSKKEFRLKSQLFKSARSMTANIDDASK